MAGRLGMPLKEQKLKKKKKKVALNLGKTLFDSQAT